MNLSLSDPSFRSRRYQVGFKMKVWRAKQDIKIYFVNREETTVTTDEERLE